MSLTIPGREVFAKAGLAEIPKLLTLQDRNRHSPTYGCFDRNYWHYKVIDFPSGMAQEFVWPLALAATLDVPGNPYYNEEALREWARAGILYAARSGHSDGSCDDYFPFEQALGAAAFSLLACAEAYAAVGMQSDEALQFFQRRARWLARRHESGRLSNHHALVALGLDVVGRLLQSDEFHGPREERIAHLLSWQKNEGWFPEYEGFDPGYDTLTVSCLARLHQIAPDAKLENALRSSISLLANFMHPDGSFGGEYGSRNTYNFFPHGFEVAGRWMPQALALNDAFLAGWSAGRAPCYSDDRILGHHAWNYLLAARDYVSDRPAAQPRPRERIELHEAGLVIDRRGTTELYLAWNKGGVLKLFRDGNLVLSDTGVSFLMRDGKTAVMHLVDDYSCDIQADRISISGVMGWAKQEKMTPLKLVMLRLINLTVGWLAPDLIRGTLQKILITGKETAPFQFVRTLEWRDNHWNILDRIEAESWRNVEAAGIGPDQTSIYVAMSRTFQRNQLQPWINLTGRISTLKDGNPLIVERTV